MRYRGRAGTKKGLKDLFDRPWHKWFAWYPITTINGNKKWLCFVCRKGNLEFMEIRDGRDSWEKPRGMYWQYTETIFDVLKDTK